MRERLGPLVALLAVAVATALGALWWVASRGGWYATWALADVVASAQVPAAEEAAAAKLERRLASYAPRGTWVTVDSHLNRLRVYRNGELLREAVTSTGSGTILKDPESGREWIFDTPQGERQVQRKVKDPVWNKPDWAFIEEGLLPPKSARERVDDFSLGDYGLYLGDGYIIHGTLFQTLLGRRVTHGCIRLGDEDLEWVYWKVPVGTRVYLY
jgi:L,D-transpeptidase YbiS